MKKGIIMIGALAIPVYLTMLSSLAASETKQECCGSATKNAPRMPPIPGSASEENGKADSAARAPGESASKEDAADAEEKTSANPVVAIETSMGTIKVELWADRSPATVKNFLKYAKDKHYDDLIFHRVIKGFMIQGGGFSADMKQKATRGPVKNEARSDVKNDRGTLAMARTPVVDSATSQFFINLVNNGSLNHRDTSQRGFGYCVFGKVIEGMEVVDKIAMVKTRRVGGHRDVPLEPVTIKSIRMAE